jgi:hypothetical protein
MSPSSTMPAPLPMLGQGWDAMGERYLQLYRRLARRPAAAGAPDTDMTLKGESR